ncbi:hypothetical protein QQ045_008657 [Rhodiola kirilowii]
MEESPKATDTTRSEESGPAINAKRFRIQYHNIISSNNYEDEDDNNRKRCIIKIDIGKAYDMVDLNFLRLIMMEFGFPSIFIKWIMNCVTSASFSLLINGKMKGLFFRTIEGYVKEIPISPFLFTLVMEIRVQIKSS